MNPERIKDEVRDIKKLCNKILADLNRNVTNIVLKEHETEKSFGGYSILEVNGSTTNYEFIHTKERSKVHEALARCLLCITEGLNPSNFVNNKQEVNIYSDVSLNDILKTKCGPDAVGFITGLANLTKVSIYPLKDYDRLDELDSYIERTIGQYETDSNLPEGDSGAA